MLYSDYLAALIATRRALSLTVTVESDGGYTDFEGNVVPGPVREVSVTGGGYSLGSQRNPQEGGARLAGGFRFLIARSDLDLSSEDVALGRVRISHGGNTWIAQELDVRHDHYGISASLPDL